MAASSADASLRPSGGPRELIVRGRVARDAGIVRVRLEAADGLAIAIAPVDPTGHGHGTWVPFEARFLVARTYSSMDGGLFVVPMTVAGVGPASDLARYPFSSSIVLALDAVESGRAIDVGERTPRRSFGNDGLIGGIAFGIPIEDR